jgi:ABC-type multidrug transport system ATPase subunit
VVILSTHIVDDVADLCPNFAIISKGRVMLTGSPAAAVASIKGKIWRRAVPREDLEAIQKALPVISSRLQSGETVVRAYADSAPETGFESVEAELEDVYFGTVTGHLVPAPLQAAA